MAASQTHKSITGGRVALDIIPQGFIPLSIPMEGEIVFTFLDIISVFLILNLSRLLLPDLARVGHNPQTLA